MNAIKRNAIKLNAMKQGRSLILCSILLGLNSALITPSSAAPLRPKASKSNFRQSPIRWTPPPPPPNLGDPGGRGQGGGRRGDCDAYQHIAAVLPRSQSWGLTTRERPTLWFHLPQGLANGVPLEIALQDQQGKPLFKKLWTAKATPAGIVPIAFPSEAPALQVNQHYRWTVSIYCDGETPDTPVTLRSAIGRIDLSADIVTKLSTQTTAIEKAAIYAEQGIWYDAITVLGMDKIEFENTRGNISIDRLVSGAWKDLLRQAGLQTLTPVPLQSFRHD